MKERIYLASSWRNPFQIAVVEQLRQGGHEVYDFRNPAPGNTGFGWQQCGETERNQKGEMTPEGWRKVLDHPQARRGFSLDYDGMRWSTVGVLLLPCGRSAHLELGWLIGSGRPCFVYCPPAVNWVELELMHLLAHPHADAASTIALSDFELLRRIDGCR